MIKARDAGVRNDSLQLDGDGGYVIIEFNEDRQVVELYHRADDVYSNVLNVPYGRFKQAVLDMIQELKGER